MVTNAESIEREGVWTPELVRVRMEEACETLARTPIPEGAWPSSHRSWWPPILRNFWEIVNSMNELERRDWMNERNRTRLQPSPQQIQRMDDALQWLWHVKRPRDAQALLAKCSGLSLRKITAADGRSHEGIRIAIDRALGQIATALQREGVPVIVAPCVGSARPH